MRLFMAAAVTAALAGCATQPQMTWKRADGGPPDAAFQPAYTQCRGEAAQAAAGSPAPAIPSTYGIVAAHRQREETLDAVMQGCMSKRGYVWTPAS